ncbi:MAG: PGF-pre-PGF domain-containing protein [Candidatus Aenigmarchaeota archaeon]|nr:PGF-pre-PGF domain-containing protein [Candidatus Aenigmarchaeota archaeon]
MASRKGLARAGVVAIALVMLAALAVQFILPAAAVPFNVTLLNISYGGTYGSAYANTFNISNNVSAARIHISVNNSNASNIFALNVTQVNITLPAGFSFVTATNVTTGPTNHTFSTFGQNITWNTSTGDIALISFDATKNFTFNVSVNWTYGNYTFYVSTLTNSSQFNQTNFTVLIGDDIRPLVTNTSPLNTTWPNQTVNFNASVFEHNPANGIAQLTQLYTGVTTNFSLTNASGVWGYTNTTLAEGPYFLRFFFNDTAQNKNATTTVSFTVNSGPPNVSITSPPNASINNHTITFNATVIDVAMDSGVLQVTNLFTGAVINYSLINASGVWGYTNTSMPEGQYRAQFHLNDTVNYMNNNQTVNFTIDHGFPNVTVTSPTNASIDNETINLNASVLDVTGYSGIVEITQADAAKTNYTLSNNSGSWGYTNTSMPDGYYSARFHINDSFGRINNTQLVNFTVAAVPRVIIISPTNTTYTTSDDLAFIIKVFDKNVANGTLQLTNLDTSSATNFSLVNSSGNFTYNHSNVGNNLWRAQYFVNDSAGNQNISANVTFTVTVAGSTSSSTTSSGGGGGGGGTTSSNPADTSIWSVITPAVPTVATIDNDEIGFTEVQFTTDTQITNGQLKVEKLADKPTALPDPAQEAIYQYVEIKTTNFDDTHLSGSPKIQFQVTNTWLAENGIEKQNVVLLRYTTEWTVLTTILTSSDADFSHFQATTPGFSTFAIAAAPAAAEPVVACGDGTCAADETFESCPADCQAPAPVAECAEGDYRCFGDTVETCTDGTWTVQESCPYGCADAVCQPQPEAPVNPFNTVTMVIVVVIVILAVVLVVLWRKK